MAQKVLVQLIDDLDGAASDDVSTVEFGIDGVTYEIDLSGSNGDKLRDLLAEYVNAGRRIGGRAKRGTRPGGGVANGEAGQIREWAEANGIELAARGRIPAHVTESYREAQKEPAATPRKRGKARAGK